VSFLFGKIDTHIQTVVGIEPEIVAVGNIGGLVEIIRGVF